jgi:hypothetical protein
MMKPRVSAHQFKGMMVATGRAEVQVLWRLVDDLKPAGILIEGSLTRQVANAKCQM